ncbi:MAG: hypothetical protein GX119_03630 [Syntrophomonadaceae bacterium]|jgi:hypothetical protein|nr:hypothetical protein [Syntrophomonadaceae bacterium]
MRAILRKLDGRKILSESEYQDLLQYIDALCESSMESYRLFYNRYSAILWQDYAVYIPKFKQEMDDLLNYLLYHPELLSQIHRTANCLELFPPDLHPYLSYLLEQEQDWALIKRISRSLSRALSKRPQLPSARKGPAVLKYERGNPYKEIGLKSHFERLARYEFITRLQSYRYLQRGKASQDQIRVLDADKLGGIYTNKDKSIYYYIFLSENDMIKAENVCLALNTALYGF